VRSRKKLKVAVIGGGTAGYMAAAHITKHFPCFENIEHKYYFSRRLRSQLNGKLFDLLIVGICFAVDSLNAPARLVWQKKHQGDESSKCRGG
jgi:hypothetical protein